MYNQQITGPVHALTVVDLACRVACGADGYSCSSPADVEPVLRKAFASPRPCLIEVEVDADTPPAPPDKLAITR